jgi:hypothetical protein
MNEIKCPHCGKTFKIDEASFAAILKQVRDSEFEKELHARIDSEVRAAEAKTKLELQAENSKKEAEIAELRAKLDNASTESQLAVAQALSKVEKERDELAVKLSGKDAELKASESSLKERYEIQIKDRDDAIERLKDMKSKLSVKLVGENLEQHCQNEFNGVRASLFPFAYFEKDNEAIKEDDEAKGTKGDYIYKDYDSQGGTEIISIMFEMKDEQDVSTNKRTVESHLDKLDKDRKKKGLEYAVLVTLLEADNELYNRGIVDVSYKYEKMYVIRPQPKVREPDKGGTVPPDGPLSYGAGDALPLLWRLREGRKGLGGSKEVSSSFVAREDRKPGGGA